MTSDLELVGDCPAPFMQEDKFSATGGFINGRICHTSPENVSCCLPCPLPDWKYPKQYRDVAEVANWLAVVCFTLNALILLSYALLPAKLTGRHYLNACMMSGVMLMALSFIVSLGAKPEECYNEITPDDMKSDVPCAFSGALIVFGGWAAVVWSFFRTLSLHLQICWDVVPGKKFFIGTLTIGWTICVAMLAIAMAVTGTSYRFGNTCHINHDYGLEDFWGPLMGVAAASLLIHATTIGYCIHIYLRSVMDESPTTENSSSLGYSGNRSLNAMTARQAYRRVRRVLKLQWRGIASVLAVLGNAIFFSVIFIQLDQAAEMTPENAVKNKGWLKCLIETGGDRFQCADRAASTGPSEAAVVAVMIFLSMVGIWTFLFFGHLSMITGFIDLVRQKFTKSNEFVSIDARDRLNGTESRAFEMYGTDAMKSPEPLLASPSMNPSEASYPQHHHHSANSDQLNTFEYPPREAKYTSPVLSFSAPRPPNMAHQPSLSREWDPRSTFAPGVGNNRSPYRTHQYTGSGFS